MNPYYAGIGSRETPPGTLILMTAIARLYHADGSILRSGGARGADTAFEAGAGSAKEIFVAGSTKAPHHFGPPTQAAIELSAKYHPNWRACSAYAKLLHGRNAHIILGRDLATPVRFVICWTQDAKSGGGTGQGIRIAKAHGIDVYDLGDPEVLSLYTDWIAGRKS